MTTDPSAVRANEHTGPVGGLDDRERVGASSWSADQSGRRDDVRKIDERIRHHVIICGFGEFGWAVLKHLGTTSPPVVFVEIDPEREAPLRRTGCPYVRGSAADPKVLEAAGVRRARVLVAGTGDESVNISIVMLARELNPSMEIHGRAESAEGTRWLRGAGATEIVDPYRLAAQVIVRDLAGGPKTS